jgi:hypothetical protein
MPIQLWEVFRYYRFLVPALSVFAANATQTLAGTRHGLQVGIISFPQTFNGRLEINPHVHTMVFVGGLYASSGFLEVTPVLRRRPLRWQRTHCCSGIGAFNYHIRGLEI